MDSEKDTSQPQLDLALRDVIPRPLDHKVIWICIICALVLTASEYFGNTRRAAGTLTALGLADFGKQFQEYCRAKLSSESYGPLWTLHYWSGAHTILYFIIPALIVKLAFRERLSDYGLKITGWYRKLWVYAGAFAVVLPCVYLVRGLPAFQRAYPFYKRAHESWGDFLGWECAYVLQFFALEFFFRGFLLHGLKHRFGYYSVLIMTVPYCMIHFGKPLPETVGAIIAGIFLGTLSLWTRSIWLGVLIHVTVAIAMDLAALSYRDELGQLFGIMSTKPT